MTQELEFEDETVYEFVCEEIEGMPGDDNEEETEPVESETAPETVAEPVPAETEPPSAKTLLLRALQRPKAREKGRTIRESTKKLPVQNGVRHPHPESMCGKIWALAEEMSIASGIIVSSDELLGKTNALDYKPSTVRTQYSKWLRFHGLNIKPTKKAKV